MISTRAVRLGGLLAWALAAVAGVAQADPYAATTLRLDWAPDEGVWEVTARVQTEALAAAVEALAAAGGTVGTLHDVPAVDRPRVFEEASFRYLKQTLIVQRPDDSVAPLRWVGMEADHRQTWLYAEVLYAPPSVPVGGDGERAIPAIDGMTISARLFFESRPEQLHAVRLRVGNQQSARTLSLETPRWTVRWPPGAATASER